MLILTKNVDADLQAGSLSDFEDFSFLNNLIYFEAKNKELYFTTEISLHFFWSSSFASSIKSLMLLSLDTGVVLSALSVRIVFVFIKDSSCVLSFKILQKSFSSFKYFNYCYLQRITISSSEFC